MSDLLKIVKQASEKRVAIGHFNFAELTVLRAIVNAARRLKAPVIVGLSEKERDFIGAKRAVALVESYRTDGTNVIARSSAKRGDEAIFKEEIASLSLAMTEIASSRESGTRNDDGTNRTDGFNIFLNADHTHSFAAVKEAVAAGFDAILFDGGRWPLAKNIRETRRAVEYIKSKNPRIIVEGELGHIGDSSQLLKKLPREAAVRPEQLTTIEEARQFVAETKVDLLAPALGTVHGIVKGRRTKLDLERIALLSSSGLTGGSTFLDSPAKRGNDRVPIVLHGASELSAAAVRAAVRAGVSVVHISTDIRLVWRRALERSLRANKNELAPYRILEKPRAAAEKVVEKWMRLISPAKRDPVLRDN